MSNPTQAELVRIDPQPMEQHRASDDPQALIALAIEKGLDLKELVAMRREWRAEKAKEAFDAAMKAFQDECPKVRKTKPVSVKDKLTNQYKIAYYYAPLDLIIEVVKDCISKHGFSWKFGEGESKDNQMAAICTVKHIGGHSEESRATLRKGSGNHLTDDTKIDAATLSFAQRRAFCGAFGIVPEGDDMEEIMAKQKPRTEGPSKIATIKSLKNELWELLKPVRGTSPNTEAATRWLRNTGILQSDEKLEGLTAERLSEVIDQATAQLQKEA